jgi:hypothetical protein
MLRRVGLSTLHSCSRLHTRDERPRFAWLFARFEALIKRAESLVIVQREAEIGSRRNKRAECVEKRRKRKRFLMRKQEEVGAFD